MRSTAWMALSAVALLAATAPSAFAQGMLGRGGAAVRPPADQRPREPAPALPGVAAQRGIAPIPAETSPSAMNPNDALFDGIARGDIQTVRDAVARGADVNARNALGLTAVDSAVDRGRPEIMFYLLSMRSTASAPPPPPERAAPDARAQRAAAAAAAAAARARPAQGSAPTASTGGTARLPQLWQANGGAPQPSIGFLGFDAGTPAGASRPTAAAATARRNRG
ncbi:ankyrin repeat domain-containing protein [Roseococcus pinisoli]|uniref:Ankyrin repeat domain-containing protein n=1 Tax=Roseococcus pinisoli TaxID=2835040 RepID=A0ABS5QBV4_9PROT|nr:ankyrin repeat domain-containing protein [Roseococcus pinisoli]MBS7810063.1 ankyrin repeat domain-containing protein [Roseococcus pinisoli]